MLLVPILILVWWMIAETHNFGGHETTLRRRCGVAPRANIGVGRAFIHAVIVAFCTKMCGTNISLINSPSMCNAPTNNGVGQEYHRILGLETPLKHTMRWSLFHP